MENSSPADDGYADIFAFSRAGAADIRLGALLCAALAVVALAVLPWARVRTPGLEAALPTVGAIALLAEFLAAGLFVSQFVVSRQPALLYVSLALGVESSYTVLWWFTMPRVYATTGISPQVLQTGPWLLVSGTIGFLVPIAMMACCDIAATARFCRDRRTVVAFGGLAALGAVANVVAAYGFPALLPMLVDGERMTPLAEAVVAPGLGVLVVAVLALIVVKRQHHAVDVWLAVALCAAGLEIVVFEVGGARDVLGFYAGRVLGAGSASAILFQMLAKMYGLLLALMRANRDLDSQASTDELTGLANRRSFNRAADALFAEQRRDDRRAALLMIDLDEFKRYNDGFGHAAGDATLAAVARAMRSSVSRAEDTTARVGGEEFAVLLRDTDLAGALAVAERIRSAIEALALPHAEGAAHACVTVSIGVASTVGDAAIATYAELAGRADAALYAAKRDGRNRVTIAPAPVANEV